MHARGGGGDVRLFVEDASQNLDSRFPLEQAFARQHFVHHYTKRPDVRALVGWPSLCLLRGHVRRCAQDGSNRRRAHGQGGRVRRIAIVRGQRLHGFRQAEIQNLDDAFGSDLDVGGLQVAMDDVLLMRGFDAVNQLLNNRQRVVEIERTLEVFAFDVLHDEVVGSDIVEVADVGVVERGNRSVN